MFVVFQRKKHVIECSHAVLIEQEIDGMPSKSYVTGIISILRSCSKDLGHNLLTRSVLTTCITQVESQASLLVEEPEEIKTYQPAMLPGWKEKVGEHETENASHVRNINITRINRF